MSPVEPSKRSKKLSYQVTHASDGSPLIETHDHPPFEPVGENGSLDTVRDILFGAQSREFEKRCDLLEQQMLQDHANLRDELTQTLDDLKGQIQKEMLQLSQQLQEEKKTRVDTFVDLKKVVQSFETNLTQGFARMDQETALQVEALQQSLVAQRKELDLQSQEAMDKLEAHFRQAVQNLMVQKTDREVLAEMLVDVGVRLKNGQSESKGT